MPQPPWSELEQALGHAFRQRLMLEQALTHSSLAYERAMARAEFAALKAEPGSLPDSAESGQDNEQMEFLGDAVLGMLVADRLFRTYPELNEGELTRLRAQLVSRKHLGQVGVALSLGMYMRLGRGEERSGGRQKAVLLANAMEAVIAALYLDGGLPAAAAFVEAWVVVPYLEELHASLQAGQAMGDHKSALQEWLQAHKRGSAQYTVKAESGPDHRKRFLVGVQIAGEDGSGGPVPLIAEGTGSTKKKAEQEAARLAYSALLGGGVAGLHRAGKVS